MKGWIFGSAKQRYWTQKIFKHSQKFQNPLHQNYKHVKALQSLLGLSDQQVHSLVVFVGDSTFKTKMPGNVTQGGGYIRFIKLHSELVLSEDEVREIVEKVESGRLKASLRTDYAHARHVQEIVGSKGQGDLFGGVTNADRISFPVQETRQREREAVLERAFFESYEEPAGCDNWRSDRHMVECVNHRMRARAEYFASKE